MLEGSRETSSGKQILLDLSAVQQYSLFPGQVRRPICFSKQVDSYLSVIYTNLRLKLVFLVIKLEITPEKTSNETGHSI